MVTLRADVTAPPAPSLADEVRSRSTNGATRVRLDLIIAQHPPSSAMSTTIEGPDLALIYEGKKCIHARFCVTGAPKVFLANVKAPGSSPDAIEVFDRLVEISHACPSGAIRYQRKERPARRKPRLRSTSRPSVRPGPYAVRGGLRLNGEPIGFRATLCRCGASKNKPFCDGSHHDVGFTASGEPATTKADMLPVRDGPLAIEPATRRPPAGARQPRDHERHRPRGRARHSSAASAAAATATANRSATAATRA